MIDEEPVHTDLFATWSKCARNEYGDPTKRIGTRFDLGLILVLDERRNGEVDRRPRLVY